VVGAGKFEHLPIGEVELDRDNPRIKRFLDIHDNPTDDNMQLALSSSGGSDEPGNDGTKFDELKQSILTNGGIIQPIIVNRVKQTKVITCIEGNTRVLLYRTFAEEGAAGDWSTIPAIVYDDMPQDQIDAIRLQVHLVGTRQWDPYSKAKYLYHLRTKELLPWSQIVDFCGGRQKDVLESINAFEDMEKYYRPLVGDGVFNIRYFSGFKELQKPGVKPALLKAKFGVADFAQWIYDEKIAPLARVRSLPLILGNDKAREIFLKPDGDAEAALAVVDRPDLSEALTTADTSQLARALAKRVYDMPWQQAKKLQDDPGSASAEALREAYLSIAQLLQLDTPEA
jgi:hypothetical protein